MELLPFNDYWKDCFQNEKKLLLEALAGHEVISVEHIGATSVLMCKTAGTIDLLCSIQDKIEMFTYKNILAIKGYQYVPSESDQNCFMFVRKNKDKKIIATIRLVEHASDAYMNIVLFKYYLQEGMKAVIKYNDFREALIEKCNGNFKVYQKRKKIFIESILNEYCKVER